MSEKLLPCPFCGGKAICSNWGMWRAWCSECKSKGSDELTEKEAIAAWNRRAQPENEALTMDELRQMGGCDDGTPIWIEPTGKYEGVWTAAWYIWPWDTKDFEIDTYADAWLAYRRKPERSEG